MMLTHKSCANCGTPIHYHAAKLCRRCYQAQATERRHNRITAAAEVSAERIARIEARIEELACEANDLKERLAAERTTLSELEKRLGPRTDAPTDVILRARAELSEPLSSGHATIQMRTASNGEKARDKYDIIADRAQPKKRICLGCRLPFDSAGAHNRICGSCADSAAASYAVNTYRPGA